MRQSAFVWGAAAAVSAFASLGERSAAACGGCFHPPTQTASDITDERMLLSVSTTQTTLYDQIRYAGQPSSFAWVLPIHGTVTVGLSADVLFNSVDALTATQITPPLSTCAPCRTAPGPLSGFAGASTGGGDHAATPPDVTVTHAENVGPYATVQLHSTDGAALNTWLTQNGFHIPDDVKPVIAQYVSEGFDFLAMKLLPNSGVRAMRPVRVTSAGASLSLPLRMAAVGTGAIVGITIWVVGDGRYEPQNFPFYHIEDKDFVWDFSTSISNYALLRVQNEATLQNAGWELESSLTLNQQIVTQVVLNGGQTYGGFGGNSGGIGALPSDPNVDYLPVPAEADAGVDASAGQTAEEVRTADLSTLFAGIVGSNARFTRMRGDIAHAAMTTDLLMKASDDQSELPNVRTLTHGVNEVCSCGYIDGDASFGSPAAGNAGSSRGRTGSANCSATLGSRAGAAGGLGALAAFVGLCFARALRARRRS